VNTALTVTIHLFPPFRVVSLTSLVRRISHMRFLPPLLVSASDLPNRMELQINPPRLQMLTSSSADLASLRYLCVIATEASNLLPLFYRSLFLSSLLTLDSCFRSVAATTLACLLHFIPTPRFLCFPADRLRCLHSSRCRTPARISGKDFPLPSCAGNNQPSLICFLFYFRSSLPLRSTRLLIACPSSPIPPNFSLQIVFFSGFL